MPALYSRIAPVLLAVCVLSLAVVLLAADPPAPVKVSSFAPAADLLDQVNFFIARAEESLADKAAYDEAKQSRTRKDAATLAVLGLALGMHDEDHAVKASAAALVKASQALTTDVENYDGAAKAFADIKKAAKGEAQDPTPLKWEKVAELGPLMKMVPLVNTPMGRMINGTRFAKQAPQAAAQAATLSAIAQESMFDTADIKTDEVAKWQTFCAEMRDAAGAVNSAARAANQNDAKAAYKRLLQSCESCHAVFRQ